MKEVKQKFAFGKGVWLFRSMLRGKECMKSLFKHIKSLELMMECYSSNKPNLNTKPYVLQLFCKLLFCKVVQGRIYEDFSQ